MPKFRVFGTMTATVELGTFEADSKEEAIGMGWESYGVFGCTVCDKCADLVELSGELEELDAEEI